MHTATIEPRMTNPALALDGALPALLGVSAAVKAGGVAQPLLDLASLRASQLNGCSWCVDMHSHDLAQAGESAQRIAAVAAWRDAPLFSDPERAVLDLAEHATRLADGGGVPLGVFEEAADHFDEQQLATIILSIGLVNLWNRLTVSTGQAPAVR